MAHTSFFCTSSFAVLHLHFTFYMLTLSPCSRRIPQKQYLKTPHLSAGSHLYWRTHGVFNHLDSERLSWGMRYIIGWRLRMGLWLLVRTLALWLWLLPTIELTVACFWTSFLLLTMEHITSCTRWYCTWIQCSGTHPSGTQTCCVELNSVFQRQPCSTSNCTWTQHFKQVTSTVDSCSSLCTLSPTDSYPTTPSMWWTKPSLHLA